MMRKYFLGFSLVVAGIVMALSTATFAAPAKSTCDPTKPQQDLFLCVCTESANTANAVGCKSNGADPINGADGILVKAELIIAFITGAAAIVMIFISGFKFVTANGDAQKVANARTTLIYSLIGLAVVAAAHGIIVFIINGIN